jgi:hypothetical protein
MKMYEVKEMAVIREETGGKQMKGDEKEEEKIAYIKWDSAFILLTFSEKTALS